MADNFRETFEYAGHALGVTVSSRETLDWLYEFFCPQFRAGVGGPSDWHIVHQIDAAVYDTLLERSRADDLHRMECFSLDGRYESGLLCAAAEGTRTIYDERYQVFYRIDRDRRCVELLSRDLSNRYRTTLMRVVRELATAHCYQQDALHVHGAAFETGGKAVVVTGPKRAGKTTLLLRALQSGRCRYIANDRVFLLPSGEQVTARGMPTVVKVRQGCLQLFPALRQRYLAQPFYFNASMDESLNCEESVKLKRRNQVLTSDLRLSGAQLCDLSHADSVGSSELGAIVFPRIDLGARGCRWELLKPRGAARRLVEGLFVSGRPMQAPEAFEFRQRKKMDTEAIAQMCRGIVERTPCFECSVGPDGIQPMLELVAKQAA